MIFSAIPQMNDTYDKMNLVFQSDRLTWYRPTTLDQLLRLKCQHPDAKIVTGNTEVG